MVQVTPQPRAPGYGGRGGGSPVRTSSGQSFAEQQAFTRRVNLLVQELPLLGEDPRLVHALATAPGDIEVMMEAAYSAVGSVNVQSLVRQMESRPDVYQYAEFNSLSPTAQRAYLNAGYEPPDFQPREHTGWLDKMLSPVEIPGSGSLRALADGLAFDSMFGLETPWSDWFHGRDNIRIDPSKTLSPSTYTAYPIGLALRGALWAGASGERQISRVLRSLTTSMEIMEGESFALSGLDHGDRWSPRTVWRALVAAERGEFFHTDASIEAAADELRTSTDALHDTQSDLALAQMYAAGYDIEEIVEERGFEFGEPGWNQEVLKVYDRLGVPAVQKAVEILDRGKMNLGRSLSRMMSLDDGSAIDPWVEGITEKLPGIPTMDGHTLISGTIDANVVMWLDPTMFLGKASKAARARFAWANFMQVGGQIDAYADITRIVRRTDGGRGIVGRTFHPGISLRELRAAYQNVELQPFLMRMGFDRLQRRVDVMNARHYIRASDKLAEAMYWEDQFSHLQQLVVQGSKVVDETPSVLRNNPTRHRLTRPWHGADVVYRKGDDIAEAQHQIRRKLGELHREMPYTTQMWGHARRHHAAATQDAWVLEPKVRTITVVEPRIGSEIGTEVVERIIVQEPRQLTRAANALDDPDAWWDFWKTTEARKQLFRSPEAIGFDPEIVHLPKITGLQHHFWHPTKRFMRSALDPGKGVDERFLDEYREVVERFFAETMGIEDAYGPLDEVDGVIARNEFDLVELRKAKKAALEEIRIEFDELWNPRKAADFGFISARLKNAGHEELAKVASIIGRPGQHVRRFIRSVAHYVPEEGLLELDSGSSIQQFIKFANAGSLGHLPDSYVDELIGMFAMGDVGTRQIVAMHFVSDTLIRSGFLQAADKRGMDVWSKFVTRVGHSYGLSNSDTTTINGFQTKFGHAMSPLKGTEYDDIIMMPSFRDLARATRAMNFTRHTFDIVAMNKYIDTAMGRFWKPAQLLRVGFVPRAGGEELISFGLRRGWKEYLGSQASIRSTAYKRLRDGKVVLADEYRESAALKLPQWFSHLGRKAYGMTDEQEVHRAVLDLMDNQDFAKWSPEQLGHRINDQILRYRDQHMMRSGIRVLDEKLFEWSLSMGDFFHELATTLHVPSKQEIGQMIGRRFVGPEAMEAAEHVMMNPAYIRYEAAIAGSIADPYRYADEHLVRGTRTIAFEDAVTQTTKHVEMGIELSEYTMATTEHSISEVLQGYSSMLARTMNDDVQRSIIERVYTRYIPDTDAVRFQNRVRELFRSEMIPVDPETGRQIIVADIGTSMAEVMSGRQTMVNMSRVARRMKPDDRLTIYRWLVDNSPPDDMTLLDLENLWAQAIEDYMVGPIRGALPDLRAAGEFTDLQIEALAVAEQGFMFRQLFHDIVTNRQNYDDQTLHRIFSGLLPDDLGDVISTQMDLSNEAVRLAQWELGRVRTQQQIRGSVKASTAGGVDVMAPLREGYTRLYFPMVHRADMAKLERILADEDARTQLIYFIWDRIQESLPKDVAESTALRGALARSLTELFQGDDSYFNVWGNFQALRGRDWIPIPSLVSGNDKLMKNITEAISDFRIEKWDELGELQVMDGLLETGMGLRLLDEAPETLPDRPLVYEDPVRWGYVEVADDMMVHPERYGTSIRPQADWWDNIDPTDTEVLREAARLGYYENHELFGLSPSMVSEATEIFDDTRLIRVEDVAGNRKWLPPERVAARRPVIRDDNVNELLERDPRGWSDTTRDMFSAGHDDDMSLFDLLEGMWDNNGRLDVEAFQRNHALAKNWVYRIRERIGIEIEHLYSDLQIAYMDEGIEGVNAYILSNPELRAFTMRWDPEERATFINMLMDPESGDGIEMFRELMITGPYRESWEYNSRVMHFLNDLDEKSAAYKVIDEITGSGMTHDVAVGTQARELADEVQAMLGTWKNPATPRDDVLYEVMAGLILDDSSYNTPYHLARITPLDNLPKEMPVPKAMGRDELTYDRVIRFGFDNVITPGIAGVTRTPHYHSNVVRSMRQIEPMKAELLGQIGPGWEDILHRYPNDQNRRRLESMLTLVWDQVDRGVEGSYLEGEPLMVMAVKAIQDGDVNTFKEVMPRLGLDWNDARSFTDEFPGSYGRHLKEAATEEVVEHIGHLRAMRVQLQEYHDLVAHRAFDLTVPYIDDHRIRSQFQEFVRAWVPFWFAEEQFLRRWARGFYETPHQLRKGQIMLNGLREMGMVREDQYGNEVFVYPGSEEFMSAVGPVLARYYGGEAVGQVFANPLTANIEYMFPGFREDVGRMEFGPVIALGMNQLANAFPEFSDLRDEMLGDLNASRFGPGTNFVPEALEMLVPTQTYRTLRGLFLKDFDAASLRSAEIQAITYLVANDLDPGPEATDDQLKEFHLKVSSIARTILMTRAATGWIGGVGMDLELTDLEVSNEFRELLNLGIPVPNAIDALVERHGGWVTPYTVFSSESTSGAPIPATAPALEWMNQNTEFIETFPHAAPWFMPQERPRGEYGIAERRARAEAIGLELRNLETPQEFLREIYFAEAAEPYFERQERYREERLAIQARLGRQAGPVLRILDDDWSTWSKAWKLRHPTFATDMEEGAGRGRRLALVEELRVLIASPELIPEVSHREQLIEMMNRTVAFVDHMESMANITGSRALEERRLARETFYFFVYQEVQDHPELAPYFSSVVRPLLTTQEITRMHFERPDVFPELLTG